MTTEHPPAPCDQPLPADYPDVAVIGGGNLGVTSAAFARARGCNTSLFIRDSVAGRKKLALLAAAENRVPFTPADAPRRTVTLDLVSDDLGRVIAGRPLIFVTVPANGHPEVARGLAPHLAPNTVIVLHPGQTHGALSIFRDLRDAGVDPAALDTLSIGELCISNFTTRSVVDNAAYSALKHYNLFSCFPSQHTDAVLPLLQKMYPSTELQVLEDALAMAFHPIAAGPHTLLTLTNLGDLARGWRYEYYTEGANEHVARLIRRFDRERCDIARAFGYEPVDVETCLQRMYDMPDRVLPELFTQNPAYHGYGSPSELTTRYFTEELPCGIKPLLELAGLAGVATPMISAVETQLDVLFEGTGLDLDAESRSLKKLGLDHLSVDELKAYVHTGEMPQR